LLNKTFLQSRPDEFTKHPPGPPMTLGNMRELSLKAEFQKGDDHDGKYQQHCRFQAK
jgi:hypothetical protein